MPRGDTGLRHGVKVTTIGTATAIGVTGDNDTWIDYGDAQPNPEKEILFLIDLVKNDSTGCHVRIVGRKSAAGTDYEAWNAAYDTWDIGSVDKNLWVNFMPKKLFPFIQVQCKATVVGATPATLTIEMTEA